MTKPSPQRVARQFLQKKGGRDLLSPTGMRLLAIFSKGGKGTLDMDFVQEVLDALDGWTITKGVGAAKLDSDDQLQKLLKGFLSQWKAKVWGYSGVKEPKDFWFATLEDAKKARQDLLRVVNQVGPKGPSSPRLGEVYVADVSEAHIGERDNRPKISTMGWWYGVPAWALTTPSGKGTKLLLKIDSHYGVLDDEHNTKMPRLFTFGYRNGLQESAQALLDAMGEAGANAVRPKSLRTRDNTGTCPVCFGQFKLSGNALVNHGYQRPPTYGIGRSYGSHIGGCFGVGRKPYELSPEGCQEYLDKQLKPLLGNIQGELRALKSGKVTELRTDNRRRPTMTTADPDWDYQLSAAVRRTERDIKAIERDIGMYEGLVKRWRKSPLPGEPGWSPVSPGSRR